MILGLGSDICDIRRIEKAIERHGDRFLERIFTATERAKAERRIGADPGGDIRQAICRKGGGGEGAWHRVPRGVFFSDLGVVNLPSGQPTLR